MDYEYAAKLVHKHAAAKRKRPAIARRLILLNFKNLFNN